MGYTDRDTNRSYQRRWWHDNKDRLSSNRLKRRAQKRIENKVACVNYLGGKCLVCGYNRCLAALDFHHIFPGDKTCEIGELLESTWDRIAIELDKCVLLCANCHREGENGCIDIIDYIM